MDLYRCLLLDTLELMKRCGGLTSGVQAIIAPHPSQDGALPVAQQCRFRRIAPPGFDFVPQVGADLGERLDNVLTYCHAEGTPPGSGHGQ